MNNSEKSKKWKEAHQIEYRAIMLNSHYKIEDEKYNRGKGNLTTKWIIDNIFSQPCAHCGKKGWQIIGCNRLDNSKPHTKDNVEPCCRECNAKLRGKDIVKEQSIKVYQYTLNYELVKIWDSARECGRNGFNDTNVGRCCKGGFTYKGKWINCKTYKGYRWSYKPL